jgi:hypothetical protein
MLLVAVGTANLFCGLYFIPQFLQNIQGMQALDSGLVLLPASLALMALMPVAGRLYDRIGARWPTGIGLGMVAYGSYRLGHLTVDTPRHFIELNMAVRNAGIGLFMMPNMTAGLATLPGDLNRAGGTTNSVMRQASASISIAVFASLTQSTAQQLLPARAELYAGGAEALPSVAHAAAHGAPGLAPLYVELGHRITTQTFADCFYLVALLTAAGALLGLTHRSGRPSTGVGSGQYTRSDGHRSGRKNSRSSST